jgi:hypothetical protein
LMFRRESVPPAFTNAIVMDWPIRHPAAVMKMTSPFEICCKFLGLARYIFVLIEFLLAIMLK